MDQEREPSVPVDNIRSLLQVVSDGLDMRLQSYRKGTRYEAVRPSDVRVFVLALRQPRSMAELARILSISRQAVQKSVHRLEALGILALQPMPGNLRDKQVVITDRGNSARSTAQDQVRQLEDACAAVIGVDGLQTLRELLLALETVFAVEGSTPFKLPV